MWKWAAPLVRVLRNLLEKSVILKERPRRRPTRHWGADFESYGIAITWAIVPKAKELRKTWEAFHTCL